MNTKLIATLSLGALALTLAGCANATALDTAKAPAASMTTPPVSDTPAPEITAVPPRPAPVAKTAAQLSSALEAGDFDPTRFPSTQDMLDSAYAGLEAKDPACMLPFGIGWGDDEQGSLAWGPSTEGSLTAVASSSADTAAATKLLSDIRAAVNTCASEPGQYTFHGMPIEMDVTPLTVDVTGADEVHAWTAKASIQGMTVPLTGAIARVGGDDVMVVGWDPKTAEKDVPQAVDEVLAGL